MAINKEKNVTIQVTFPKEDASQLEALRLAFENNGIKVSKSDILVRAFRDYLRILVMTSAHPIEQEDNGEDPKEEIKDA